MTDQDHAAEVKRLTAERDEAGEAIKQLTAETGRLKWERDTLTARVAELESGIREWITDADAVFESPGQMRAEWQKSYRRFKAALSPLPTAGDEGESWAWSKEDSERLKKVAAWVEATDPAPAEPASPAEERPSKLRDESWIREAADAEDQHASVCAGDMAPRKPACLDGVPAVLCEDASMLSDRGRVWAFGGIVLGRVFCVWSHCGVWRSGSYRTDLLTPIHHDPTDAAAVELAGRIAEGGKDG